MRKTFSMHIWLSCKHVDKTCLSPRQVCRQKNIIIQMLLKVEGKLEKLSRASPQTRSKRSLGQTIDRLPVGKWTPKIICHYFGCSRAERQTENSYSQREHSKTWPNLKFVKKASTDVKIWLVIFPAATRRFPVPGCFPECSRRLPAISAANLFWASTRLPTPYEMTMCWHYPAARGPKLWRKFICHALALIVLWRPRLNQL